MLRLTPVVKNLLLLNLFFFVAVYLDQEIGRSSYGNPQGILGLRDMLALHYPESPNFMPVQLATHFFMHGGFMHIFFNMFALVMFGPLLEAQWGPKRFLTYYFVCAFGSAALHMGYTWWDMSQMQEQIAAFQSTPSLALFNTFFEGVPLDRYRLENGDSVIALANKIRTALDENDLTYASQQGSMLMREWYETMRDIPMVGASGAIYGLLLAFGMYYPDFKLMLIFLPIPIKARYFIPILMIVELYLGFQRYSWDNIAHFAHLGGALVGLLLILYWRKFDPPNVQRWN